MKIDRHNYEEVFILYWDNELTAAEKQAVENFVHQNADLREEFEILGEARFAPDNAVQFGEKDFLLNDSFINITNYEEQLLNYIDDEITARERKEVEKFVAQNPAAQKELALFQKTKLQPAAEISFPDKSVLYRREEKVRVISMTWFRVAVAAAIIVIAGLVVFQFINTGEDAITSQIATTDTLKNNSDNNNPNAPAEPKRQEDEVNTASVDKQEGKQTKKNPALKETVDEVAITQRSIEQGKNENNLPVPRDEVIARNQDETITKPDLDVDLEKVREVQETVPGAINTSFTNTDVTNKSELALYIPEAEEKEKDGGGLKGFLRKTTRVFERRTKIQTTTEDNKLLVGAFAVSLK